MDFVQLILSSILNSSSILFILNDKTEGLFSTNASFQLLLDKNQNNNNRFEINNDIKILHREDKQVPLNTIKVRENIFIRKETSPTLNRDGALISKDLYMIPFLKHLELGRLRRRVPEVDQLVTIQLPSAEDGERFLQNIQIKNVRDAELYQNAFGE